MLDQNPQNLAIAPGCILWNSSFRSRRGSLQLFKPRTHVLTLSTSSRITVFTVWTVDFQDGQQVATPTSQVPSLVSRGRFQRFLRTIGDGQGENCSKGSNPKEQQSSTECHEESAEVSGCVMSRPQARGWQGVGPCLHRRVWQIEFPSAVEANPVCAVFNREHTAEVTVPAPKNKLEDTQDQFHKSCVRCRRSKPPLASSHPSSERTLA
jgi:hypothetical protein